MSTDTTEPTVYLVIAGSAITRDASGEILEAVDYDENGKPIWADAGICDARLGWGGADDPFTALVAALDAAELNAKLLGYDEIVRVP